MDERRSERPYHHGNLRAALVDAATAAVVAEGPASLSLRRLAREVGVSHGAATHHFGDKSGLLTAVAVEGYRRLEVGLREAWRATGEFAAVGAAYVRFATRHPGHFDVMFRPDLYRNDDAELGRARSAAAAVLYEAAGQVADAADGDAMLAGVAGWASVHGIATLWRDGNLPADVADDPVALAERITPLLFQRSIAATAPPRNRQRGPAARSR